MPAGFEVYNADGSLQFDISRRLLRVVDVFDTGTSGGTRTVGGLATGTALFLLTKPAMGVPPTVTASGTTVSWSFSAAPAVNTKVTVMVY